MTRDVLIEFLRRQPFEPFDITLSTGERKRVEHPELAGLARTTLWLFTPQDDRQTTITLHHIVSVEPIAAKTVAST
ncbi:MAG: hypothetical protein AB7Q45_01110 [Planctomycetaceae bacterium]